MKSREQIDLDFTKAKQQAEELMALSAEVKGMANTNLDEIQAGIHAAWASDNSTRYRRKVNQVQNDIRTTAKDLENIALAILEIANTAYEAEMEAWSIANGRTGY